MKVLSKACLVAWEEIVQEFGRSKLLEELRKPFNSQELRQLALRLTGGA